MIYLACAGTFLIAVALTLKAVAISLNHLIRQEREKAKEIINATSDDVCLELVFADRLIEAAQAMQDAGKIRIKDLVKICIAADVLGEISRDEDEEEEDEPVIRINNDQHRIN